MSYRYEFSRDYGHTWAECTKARALHFCADSHTSLAMAEISGPYGYMPPESPYHGVMVRRVEVDE
jgi:hypothetical protein